MKYEVIMNCIQIDIAAEMEQVYKKGDDKTC